jgi:hypothetical protein
MGLNIDDIVEANLRYFFHMDLRRSTRIEFDARAVIFGCHGSVGVPSYRGTPSRLDGFFVVAVFHARSPITALAVSNIAWPVRPDRRY